MNEVPGENRLIRLLGSAVGSQALLSAASLLVGLLLIRRSSSEQYGAYVLVANAFLLLSSLQNAYVGPPMVMRLTPLDAAARGELVSAIRHEQMRLLRPAFGTLALLAGAAWLCGWLSSATAMLLLTAVLAAPAALGREYLRTASLVQRRPQDVVRADLLYASLLVAGAAAATLGPWPAATAVLSLGFAALAGATVLSRRLQRSRPWGDPPESGILRQFVDVGAWSVAGAAIHWTLSQGYGYVVAATLDVSAVAAIAATRLLLMPVNLLSTGVGSLMLPLAAEWLHRRGAVTVLRRLWLSALLLSAVAACYIVAMWLLRDWLFAHVLKRDFAQRDLLLLLWSAISLLMVLRDQTVHLIVVRARQRRLTGITLCSALLSLLLGWWGMRQIGVAGALVGMLCGELVNLLGILACSVSEVLSDRAGERAQAVTAS